MKSVLLASIFPIFLQSPEYLSFIDSKTELNQFGITLPPKKTQDFSTREERLDDLFEFNDNLVQDLLLEAAASVDELEVETLLSSGDWLVNLLTSIENLNFCVSLATARADRPNFPLVYVNKAFEETTGYDRADIVGQNCKFLQSEWTEPEQIRLMSHALANAQPVKVALTNKRKNGTEFLNLLSMKPVFDSQGVYSYVLGVQYDLSQTETHIQDIKLVDDLLSILPNILQ
jgi:PAS domain S-box-containing protein